MSASSRLRNCAIEGSSSRSEPARSVSDEPGRRLEALQRAALDLACIEQRVELTQRRAGIGALEIVLGPEQALPAGLPLAARNRAQRVEPARDRAQEPLLGGNVGGDRPEQRRLRLGGAVGAAEALDGGIGLPAGLQQIVDPQPLIAGRKIGVIAAARAACL